MLNSKGVQLMPLIVISTKYKFSKLQTHPSQKFCEKKRRNPAPGFNTLYPFYLKIAQITTE